MENLKNICKKYLIQDFAICKFSDIQTFISCRASHRIPNNAKSIISFVFPYFVNYFAKSNVSIYAIVPDYHGVIGKILDNIINDLKEIYPKFDFVPFVDSSPIPEVYAAAISGLGFIGKNNQLITKKWGAFVFIAAIVSTLDFEIPQRNILTCSKCDKCIKACPTGALCYNKFKKEKCRSFITQKKGELSLWETEQIKLGGLVWGCDICLKACPHNKNPKQTYIKEFAENPQPILNYNNIDYLIKSMAYGYRGKNILIRNLNILQE